jgi:2-oxoglutarate dehydrogenase E1 component
MPDDSFLGAGDPGVFDDLYRRFLDDPHSVPRDWARRLAQELDAPSASPNAASLIDAFRSRGHLAARLDPLGLAAVPDVPELDPGLYGLDAVTAASLVPRLERAYCGSIGWEFMHIHAIDRREWMQRRAEQDAAADPAIRSWILETLTRTEVFESFMQSRFPAVKRFGIEGGESFILFVEALLGRSVELGIEEVVAGGMHRGRLALLALCMGKPLVPLMSEVKGRSPLPPGFDAASDVPYHLGHSGEREVAGRTLRTSLSPHPSHLQVVGSVTLGRARAKQSRHGTKALPLLVHTDAGFAGQGIMAEIFQLSKLEPFATGGTVHVIVNNQVGFTTNPDEGRSARYCSDIAKMVEAPVLHVNAEDPDAVCRAARVAAEWRDAFASDIVVDLVCYRRYGHNEIDEPRFTQPRMYAAIDTRPPVRASYGERIAAEGIDIGAAEAAGQALREQLAAAYDQAEAYEPNHVDWFGGAWQGLRAGTLEDMTAFVETGVPVETLRELARSITRIGEGFTVNSKVARFLEQRLRSVEEGEGINWATAEALAFATLLAEGKGLRFGGQDSPRGAFTQRHLILHDQETGARRCVLDGIAPEQALAEVFNTPLTEYAVLGFEYGHSVADPQTLTVWEAQFGDFLNIAQAVVDQFIACGEDRWQRSSGLVMLLPHGLDGGGPDHSTARPERLLSLCADANLQVVNASTPANFFHVLRRQMHRPFRKPLAILTPKALLRHKQAVSSIADFVTGTGFRALIPDAQRNARRVILCSGKVFYELAAERDARGLRDVALLRLEQLWPLAEQALREGLACHPNAELVWCQEEPANMGPFMVLDRHLERIAGRPIRYAGRSAAATPAAGFKSRHEAERQALLDSALAG